MKKLIVFALALMAGAAAASSSPAASPQDLSDRGQVQAPWAPRQDGINMSNDSGVVDEADVSAEDVDVDFQGSDDEIDGIDNDGDGIVDGGRVGLCLWRCPDGRTGWAYASSLADCRAKAIAACR